MGRLRCAAGCGPAVSDRVGLDRVAVARDRANQARGMGDDTDAMIQGVRDVNVAVPVRW